MFCKTYRSKTNDKRDILILFIYEQIVQCTCSYPSRQRTGAMYFLHKATDAFQNLDPDCGSARHWRAADRSSGLLETGVA